MPLAGFYAAPARIIRAVPWPVMPAPFSSWFLVFARRRAAVIGCATLLTLLFSITVMLRFPAIHSDALSPHKTLRYWNEETLAHTLAILQGYDTALRSGVAITGLPGLPLARDEQRVGRRLPWIDDVEWDPNNPRTSFIEDIHGAPVYISFPVGGFWILYGLTSLVSDTVDTVSVRVASLMLQGLTTVGIAWFVWAGLSGSASGLRAVGASVAGVAWLTATETWHSTLAAPWSHHVAQPIFMLLMVAFVLLEGRRRTAALFLLAGTGGMIEWSAHLLAAGLGLGAVVLAAFGKTSVRRAAVDVLALGTGSTLALVATVAHMAWAVGLDAWIARIMVRIEIRGVEQATMDDLLTGLGMSAGPWMAAAALLAFMAARDRLPGWSTISSGERVSMDPVVVHQTARAAAAVLALAIAAMEVFILRQHAAIYSFAALKALGVASIVAGMGFALVLGERRRAGAPLLIAALALGVLGSAYTTKTVYGGGGSLDAGVERVMAAQIRAEVPVASLPILIPMENHGIGVWMEERLPHAPDVRAALDLARRRGANTLSLVFLNEERSWAQARHASIDRIVTFRLDDIPPALTGTVPTSGNSSATNATNGIKDGRPEGAGR